MSNSNVDILYKQLKKNGATGGKIIGAGGGGFLMVYVLKKININLKNILTQKTWIF